MANCLDAIGNHGFLVEKVGISPVKITTSKNLAERGKTMAR